MKVDVIILGSSFAGSLTALALSRLGRSVCVIDRARHPRFAIGESSTPTADFVIEALADRFDWPWLRPLSRYGSARQDLPAVQIGLKRGFSYFHHRQHELFQADADHSTELLVTASTSDHVADTHWYRASVDHWFADQVRQAGLPLYEETRYDITRSGDSWRVDGESGGQPLLIEGDFVVDSTGTGSALSQHVSGVDRSQTMRTRSRAIYGHFRNVVPWRDLLTAYGISTADHPFDCDSAALHHIIPGGWMWQLRFDNGITSAGFGLDCEQHPLSQDISPTAEWRVLLSQFPSIAAQFHSATPVAPFSAAEPVRRTARLQRLQSPAAGVGWAMLPGTAGFIDPFFSTGIALSLLGVERLATCFERGRDRVPNLAELQGYSLSTHRELEFADALIAGAYRCFGQDPRLLADLSMIYFAGATTYERRRKAAQSLDDIPACLLADHPDWSAVVATLLERLTLATTGLLSAAAFGEEVRLALRPFNHVGLCDPLAHNMYHHTGAPK